MRPINYSELREHLKENFDTVLENETELVVKRPKGKGNIVILSESSYNSMVETAHLLSTEANRAHLTKSIQQAKSGKVKTIDINKLWK